jgi:hypothetical protein
MREKKNILLTIILFILLLITAFELIFFIFPGNILKSVIPLGLIDNANVSQEKNPDTYTVNSSQYNDFVNENLAINPRILWSVGNYKKSILKSSVINNELEGVITEINQSGGVFKDFNWKLRITLKGEGQDENYLGFSQASLEQLEIVTLENGSEIPIQLTDLKVNDNIRYIQVLNLLGHYETNGIKLKIIKL